MLGGAAFVFLWALFAWTTGCSSKTEQAPSPSPADTAKSPSGAPPLPTSSQGAIHLDPPELALDGGSSRSSPLAHFTAQLRALSSGQRTDHVRILFMGDSHAQADFLSGALRTALQARYGDGGPGFVHVGLRKSRHDQLNVSVEGLWRTEPKQPSFTQLTGDGVFGLGGTLAIGTSDPLRVTVTPRQPEQYTDLKWDICFKPSAPDDVISVTGAGVQPLRLVGPTGLQHREVRTRAPHQLGLTVDKGSPALCGIVIETVPGSKPGIVLSTIGIVGAAYATPLTWDLSHWKDEVSRHPPDLVIVEYGTNEATDERQDPQKFADHLGQLIARLRQVAPNASCLVVSPTDRSDRERRVAELYPAYAEEARNGGCYFWDLYALMGGRGSMRRLKAHKPPWAATDGVHFTEPGYRHFGEILAQQLMSAAQR